MRLLVKLLDQGNEINLSAGTIIDIPATKASLDFLTGQHDASQKSDESQFVKVEIYFNSNLRRTGKDIQVTNSGTYLAVDPHSFTAAQTIPNIEFTVRDADPDRLGDIKILTKTPFQSGEPKGQWLYATRNIDSTVNAVRSDVVISGPNKRPIGRFPISIIVPSNTR